MLLFELLIVILVGFSAGFLAYSFFGWLIEKSTEVSEYLENRSLFQPGSGVMDSIRPAILTFIPLSRRVFSVDYRNKLHKDLIAAGSPGNLTGEEYASLVLLTPVVVIFFVGLSMLSLPPGTRVWLIPLIPIFIFLVARMPKVSKEKRLTQIVREIPYAVDLMRLVIRAGGTDMEAVDEYVQRGRADDPFRQEMKKVRDDMMLGDNLQRALAKMANRIPLEELSSLTTAMKQAQEFGGAKLEDVLASQGDFLRTKRRQRAEKMAKEAAAQISLPTVLSFISTLIFMLAPPLLDTFSSGIF